MEGQLLIIKHLGAAGLVSPEVALAALHAHYLAAAGNMEAAAC